MWKGYWKRSKVVSTKDELDISSLKDQEELRRKVEEQVKQIREASAAVDQAIVRHRFLVEDLAEKVVNFIVPSRNGNDSS